MKTYVTQNIINCRDLGGYSCNGGVTAFGKAVRCGIPRNPTYEDIIFLKNLGIKNIIDLRGIEEADERPSIFSSLAEFNYYHITTLEANPALNKTNSPIWELYAMSLEEYGENYAKILRAIISFKEPFLFHCFLGKDRTGLIAAILLDAAGVSKEDIIKDYCTSWDYIKPFAAEEIKNNTGLIWEQDESRLRSDRENMENILDYFDRGYGGIKGYLSNIGLTDDEINLLGKVLL